MENIFIIIVAILFVLAISDLVVGVSNDAVNFLNSAFGAKVASKNWIMAVAAAGILVGSTFSSGMMEIAKSGVINPEAFYFSDVMMIFLAVMLADIILLDLFNSLGLPTSTTVSIVFELLGAGVVLALFKTIQGGYSLDNIGQYINASKSIVIVTAIFMSVFLAFTFGAIIQYISRVIFTFQYEKRMPYFGAAWGGLAMTSLTYFLLLKGLKGASFVSERALEFIEGNQSLILIISFALWAIILHVAITVFKKNILRFVVLSGTFALAMAFAGNDLVNFIGVPIAGFEAYSAWQASELAPDEMTMELMKAPVKTNSIYLIIAGIIMVLTLYFSKKARTVLETQVNLSRQEEGEERFRPHGSARVLVAVSIGLGRILKILLPRSFQKASNKSFVPATSNDEGTAFDLVRAAVNLTVASGLIALGTSYKLPLSTTYVTFMVAMGTSLSDRAWGRESAVYRVSGVLNVIGGWFVTAISAFLISGVFVAVLAIAGFNAVFVLLGLVALAIGRSFFAHRKSEVKKDKRKKGTLFELANKKSHERLKEHMSASFEQAAKSVRQSLLGLIEESELTLKKADQELKLFEMDYQQVELDLYKSIKDSGKKDLEQYHNYLGLFGKTQDLLQSAQYISDTCKDHVKNRHLPPNRTQSELLRKLNSSLEDLGKKAAKYEDCKDLIKKIDALLKEVLSYQFEGVHDKRLGAKNSLLMFRLATEIRELSKSLSDLSESIKSSAPKKD